MSKLKYVWDKNTTTYIVLEETKRDQPMLKAEKKSNKISRKE